MSLELAITAIRRIEAPRPVVRRAFAQLMSLPPELEADGEPLFVTMRPLGLPFRVKGLLRAAPGGDIVITCRWLGVSSTQRYSFQNIQSATLVRVHEHLQGWALAPLHLLAAARRQDKMLQQWLDDLAAESAALARLPGPEPSAAQ